jgi:hypothetical protein
MLSAHMMRTLVLPKLQIIYIDMAMITHNSKKVYCADIFISSLSFSDEYCRRYIADELQIIRFE